MRRSLATSLTALSLGLAACAPARPAQEPPLRETRSYPKHEVQATFTQTGTRLIIATRRGLCDIEERELARGTSSSGTSWALPSLSFGSIDGKALLAGVGFLGLSSPFFVLGAHAKTGNDRALAYGYAVTFAAAGAAVVIGVLVSAASVTPRQVSTPTPATTNPVLSEVWKKDVPCPEPHVAPWILIGLRTPDGGAYLGKTDLYGRLDVDLRAVDTDKLGGAARGQLVVDDRAVGEVDLTELQKDRAAAREKRDRAAQEEEARAWAEVDVLACLAGIELACTVAAQHLLRFPDGPHVPLLRVTLEQRAATPDKKRPRSCANACSAYCVGTGDCSKSCEARWCK